VLDGADVDGADGVTVGADRDDTGIGFEAVDLTQLLLDVMGVVASWEMFTVCDSCTGLLNPYYCSRL